MSVDSNDNDVFSNNDNSDVIMRKIMILMVTQVTKMCSHRLGKWSLSKIVQCLIQNLHTLFSQPATDTVVNVPFLVIHCSHYHLYFER